MYMLIADSVMVALYHRCWLSWIGYNNCFGAFTIFCFLLFNFLWPPTYGEEDILILVRILLALASSLA